MELDPVQLEQRYLAPYSVYTGYMGRGKEAFQVATKHAISDLQKEAVAWKIVLVILLVAPTITVDTVDHDAATLQSLQDACLGWLESLF